MPDRNRGRGRQGRARRQPTNWARDVAAVHVAVAAGVKVNLVNFAVTVLGVGETVRRTRGWIHVSADAAVVQDQLGAFGMVVVNDRAVLAGAASIPGPVTDASDDGWFLWIPILQRSALVAEGRIGFRYEFDSKAMRRVEEGFQVAVMVENAGANTFRIACGISLLASIS